MVRPIAAITGASSGLGRTFATFLAARGYDLLLIARRRELLESLARELELDYNISVEVMTADLSNESELRKVENHLLELENLEFMINNAGFGGNRVFPDIDTELETDMIKVHCIATMRCSRAALVPMVRRGKGRIINLASVAGFLTGDGSADYSATKSYVIAFSKSLQCDVGRKGIRVQALCPGFTRTGFHDTDCMKNSTIKQKVPWFLWLRAERVVNASLNAIERKCFYRVICIPTLLYKIITFFGSEWCFSPLRILFSRGKVR